MSQSNQNTSTAGSNKKTAKQSLPMWAEFARALATRVEDGGVEVMTDKNTASGFPENKNWVRIEHAESGSKLYIPKGKTQIRHLETTIELQPDLTRGILPLPQPKNGKPYSNGAIRSHLAPDPEKAASLFVQAIEAGAKKPEKRAPRTQQAAAPVEEAEVSDAELNLAVAQEELAEAEQKQQTVGVAR